MDLRCRQVEAIRERAGVGAILLVGSEAVTWLTGCPLPRPLGAELFAAPPMAVLGAAEAPVVVVSEDLRATFDDLAIELLTYPGYTLEPLQSVQGARDHILKVLSGVGAVGVDPGKARAAYVDGLDVVDVAGDLLAARVIKSDDEIEKISRSVEVCDVGQEALRRTISAGMTELDLWSQVCAAMESEVGGPVDLIADFVSGPRTAHVEGTAGPRRLEHGDLVLADIVPVVEGYWGDSCATVAVPGAPPSEDAREAYGRVREVFDMAIASCGPGMTAGDLDALMREPLGYPHHSGHGIGVTVHEEPRVVPGNPIQLEPGMVIALEPGLYTESVGIRLEQVVVVTNDGVEVLSGHSVGLEAEV